MTPHEELQGATITTDVPLASDQIDIADLRSALSRAGMPSVRGPLSTKSLLGGRTGAELIRVQVGSRPEPGYRNRQAISHLGERL